MKKQFKLLLVRYRELSNELCEYTDKFDDRMDSDIMGYIAEFESGDYSNIEWLQNQVDAFESILRGYEMMRYLFNNRYN